MPVEVNGQSTTASPTPDDTAIVMYTSGSTGTPKVKKEETQVIIIRSNSHKKICEYNDNGVLKVLYFFSQGVVLTHRNLVACMKCIMFMLNPKPDECYIAYLPLAHVLELLSENTMMLLGIKVG